MLYLFDLDNTLVRTDDLAGVREAGVRDSSASYLSQLKTAVGDASARLIWSEDQIRRLLDKAPMSQDSENQLGVFTRSPQSYTTCLLESCYPTIKWDVVISYGDVAPHFKPHGHGIALAREKLGISEVMVIGDDAADIKAAYHAVCWTAWDETKHGGKFNFDAYELLPDFIYSDVDGFIAAMDDPIAQLMALEVFEADRAAAAPKVKGNSRTITLFCPERKAHKIRVFGKHFSRYAPLKAIRARHNVTLEIEACKDADTFPDMWVAVLIQACRDQLPYFGRRRPEGRVVLTCVPPRPTRAHRLGKLVRQCEQVYRQFFGEDRVIFNPDVFRFKEGVRSNSNDHLGREERFANITSHLEFGPNANLHDQDTVIVFDDVVTSGSTLIGAKKLLTDHPVGSIQLLALAKNIGNIMPEKWAHEALYDPDK